MVYGFTTYYKRDYTDNDWNVQLKPLGEIINYNKYSTYKVFEDIQFDDKLQGMPLYSMPL